MKLQFPPTPSGQYALPKLSYLGKLFKLKDPYHKDYGKVLEKLFEQFPESRNFYNYRKGEMGPDYLKIRDVETLKRWENSQAGDFLTLNCDLEKNKGKSVETVREESNDFLLSAFHVACILLQDSEVLNGGWEGIDCPGDDYDWLADGRWTGCPYFCRGVGQLEFDARGSGDTDDCFGSAVSFGSDSSLLEPSPLLVPLDSEIKITEIEWNNIKWVPKDE